VSDYTIKNLREVKDMAAGSDFGERQEARFARGDLEAEHTGVAYQIVKPGKRQAFGHRHHEAEEVYVVLGGRGRVKLGEEVVELAPMDALRVAPPVMRAFEAGPEGLELLVFGPHHSGDGETDPEFWTD
jgi:mannose-6-phosphate isomerase-like protein (cupin superfamily)